MPRSFKYFRLVFILFCLVFFCTGNCHPAHAARTIFSVDSYDWAPLGSTVTVDIYVEDPRQLYGCSFELHYDENIVRAVSVEKGNLLFAEGHRLNADLNRADGGIISIYWNNVYNNPVPYDGQLFRISFRVLNEGGTTLTLRGLNPLEKYSNGASPEIRNGFINTSATGNTSLGINTGSYLPGAIRQIWYSTTLSAKGGRTPYTWSRTSGSLPPGLTLDSDGTISGTPISTGTYSITIRLSDDNGHQISRTFYLTVHDTGEIPLAITSYATLDRGRKGSSYTATLSARGGNTPYSWSRTSGSLPPGLTLNSRGVISGTPTATGTYTFTARVTDDNNARQEEQFLLTILDTDTDYLTSDEDLFKALHITRSTMKLDLRPDNMPYTMLVNNDVNWINLSIVPHHPSDWLRINGTSYYRGSLRTVPLSKGTNQITIGISSTGNNYHNYSLTIYRLP